MRHDRPARSPSGPEPVDGLAVFTKAIEAAGIVLAVVCVRRPAVLRFVRRNGPPDRQPGPSPLPLTGGSSPCSARWSRWLSPAGCTWGTGTTRDPLGACEPIRRGPLTRARRLARHEHGWPEAGGDRQVRAPVVPAFPTVALDPESREWLAVAGVRRASRATRPWLACTHFCLRAARFEVARRRRDASPSSWRRLRRHCEPGRRRCVAKRAPASSTTSAARAGSRPGRTSSRCSRRR